jgi:hypothetical protein
MKNEINQSNENVNLRINELKNDMKNEINQSNENVNLRINELNNKLDQLLHLVAKIT